METKIVRVHVDYEQDLAHTVDLIVRVPMTTDADDLSEVVADYVANNKIEWDDVRLRDGSGYTVSEKGTFEDEELSADEHAAVIDLGPTIRAMEKLWVKKVKA